MHHSQGVSAAAIALLAVTSSASADGDAQRGAEAYRACVACHLLEPGLHLTGPSLAGLVGRTAGTAEGFDRYSPELREADFEWEAGTLDAFLADPQAMFPGTYMMFPGLRDASARADLIAFLTLATASGGMEEAVEQGLITADAARGSGASTARRSAIRGAGDRHPTLRRQLFHHHRGRN